MENGNSCSMCHCSFYDKVFFKEEVLDASAKLWGIPDDQKHILVTVVCGECAALCLRTHDLLRNMDPEKRETYILLNEPDEKIADGLIDFYRMQDSKGIT